MVAVKSQFTAFYASLFLLMNRDGIISSRSNTNPKLHGQVIHQCLEEMLEASQLNWTDIEAVCVLNGPGSYTGLRISLAAAKGICFAKAIPLILLNKLNVMNQIARKCLGKETVCSIIKAREGEYFFGLQGAKEDQTETFSLFNKSEIDVEIIKTKATLFVLDEQLRFEFPEARLLNIQEIDIHERCYSEFMQNHVADLAFSEPFYLKNVHINKINKL